MSRRILMTPAALKSNPVESDETEVEIVDLSKVYGNRYNPETRTHEEDLQKLKTSLEENGQLSPIHVVEFLDGTFQIADGHRRVTAMELLGLKTARAFVHRNHGGNPQALLDKLFVQLNVATKPFNGRDRVNVGLQGGPTFDPNSRSTVAQLEALFTGAERGVLIDQEATSTVLAIAKRSTKYVLNGSGIGEDTPTFKNRLRNHVLYFLRNNAQQAATAYMRLGYDREALKKAIDNNRPPPRTSTPVLVANWNKKKS